MPRMNKRQRDRFYAATAFKELRLNQFATDGTIMNLGEHCRGCGVMVAKNQKHATSDIPIGILDCIANDGDHSSVEKLQLLCKSCNAIKNPTIPNNPNRGTMTYSQQKNEKGKRKFRPYAIKLMTDSPNGNYEYDDMVASGAEYCDLETVTIERYMKRLLSSKGPFMLVNGIVFWKDNADVSKWADSSNQWQPVPAIKQE